MNFDELEIMVKKPDLHWKLLNALAHLESQGHQKLLRYVRRSGRRDSKILKHLAEEARHARLLRDFATSLAEQRKHNTTWEAPTYLRKIELFVLREMKARKLEGDKICYLVTTLVIEERALKFYPLHESVLRSLKSDYSVASIIEDEEEHLRMVREELISIIGVSDLIASTLREEEKLFNAFIFPLLNESFILSHPRTPI